MRGDVSKKPFVDIVLYSQESYPVILGTYLPFMGELLDKSRSDVTGFFATTFPFTSCLENAVDFINKNIFHEFGYGVVISIFGYIYFYFPLSLMVIYLVFYITNIIINTIRKIDEAFVVFSLYFFCENFLSFEEWNCCQLYFRCFGVNVFLLSSFFIFEEIFKF